MLFKKLLSIGAASALMLGLTGCTPKIIVKTPPAETLRISYYNGKYGDAWMKSLASAFKKLNPGVSIVLSGSSSIDRSIGFTLISGKNEPDVAFVSQTNWQTWAEDGYLADLTGLYGSATDTGDVFSDKLQPGLLGYCSYKGSYWIVPWGDGAAGFIYNAKMFETSGWEVPATVSALDGLTDQITAAGIAPFSWGGQNSGYWDLAVDGWWAQVEGVAGMRDYLAMSTPQAYRQKGRLTGLQIFQNIVANTENSIDNPVGTDSQKAISAFYGGKAAMMPGGYMTLMETKYKPPKGFKMLMMPLPAAADAKEGNISCMMAGDFAFVPAAARNPALAVKLLDFMAGDQALTLFTQSTGAPAPFRYDAADVAGLDDLAQSEAQLWGDCSKVYKYSKNPVYYNGFFDWPAGGSPLMMIYAGGMTAKQAFDDNYNYASSNWQAAVSGGT